jgi:hypothetical protein
MMPVILKFDAVMGVIFVRGTMTISPVVKEGASGIIKVAHLELFYHLIIQSKIIDNQSTVYPSLKVCSCGT